MFCSQPMSSPNPAKTPSHSQYAYTMTAVAIKPAPAVSDPRGKRLIQCTGNDPWDEFYEVLLAIRASSARWCICNLSRYCRVISGYDGLAPFHQYHLPSPHSLTPRHRSTSPHVYAVTTVLVDHNSRQNDVHNGSQETKEITAR